MADKFLYETLDSVSQMGFLRREIPSCLKDNLNPKFELRPYQEEAFIRFFHCFEKDFPGKDWPLHFLFNMATGSGKTLIMAGLILYLYKKGYRNFLFFVNSTNIIEKTRDNFLNSISYKYLFNETIHFGANPISITQCPNFEGVNDNDINICFTTIQRLHSDLTTEKENAITFVDFRDKQIALLADEAHHINVSTKSGRELLESWENTVERIFRQNEDNLLLEFTATHDFETPPMVEKYCNKVLNRYDLLQFRNDRFSKDVVIVQSDFDLNERILQALILNQYKQEVAAKYQINLKPVILFKAQRTIAQSWENKANFHNLVEALTEEDIARLRSSDIALVWRAFQFFEAHHISDAQLAERLKRAFHEDYCISVNAEKEKEKHQILVNTLEDRDNPIRAIFAVQKLNEGWDVLNLFDIVRCYETRDSGKNRIGKTTISEAQLIGRGARYFPFVLPGNSDRFRRKFDDDLENELRVLEELHYHSIHDSRYISELRTALIAQGMMDEREVIRKLKLKDPFKKTDFYKFGVVWLNDRRRKNYQNVKSFTDLGVKMKNHIHDIATGHGGVQTVLEDGGQGLIVKDENRRDMRVRDINRNIVQSAIARNPFFTFVSLRRYFPNLGSIREFIESENYLGGLEITFEGRVSRLKDNRNEQREAVSGLLRQIESEIRQQITEYEGSRGFRSFRAHKIFKDKALKFDPRSPQSKEDAQFAHFVSSKDWFPFNTIYGTSEEKAFVRMLDRQMENLRKKYDRIYLMRNERHFKIYRFDDGQAFEPDFVLFLREHDGNMLIYQVFVEPKGKHLKAHEKWKQDFLKQLTEKFEGKTLEFNTLGKTEKFRLVGAPFYNLEDENRFKKSLYEVVKD